ncbi:MAG: tRNA (adenosine(37)-N6)-threonylcarbamoyltransferase complex ATPase subunit type 1 TsaE [Actinobacteria bacterium HGW-Actinobacteria-7]|jgi:tRNA threonylcarbamoyladenosine biosynthesis protein TsaE|nr:MAG: tRNA (adenosine(37)-N6)-threonylcarbamoyltransferase complex ATPase subunit type 1 TsaE [Actinobacteria bacterium HGW-Actinobacteria-7]
MTWSITTFSANQTFQCGRTLAPLLVAGDVVLLSGDLGAGKTQLTKGMADGLGVVEPVTSPTFNILLVHEGRLPLYHFDLYRLDRGAQLEDLDYYGTLEAGGVAVVEWGDRFAEAMPDDGISVTLNIVGDESRRIDLAPLGSRGAELAAAWAAGCDAVPGISVVESSR